MADESTTPKIGIAIIGAGIFSREKHLPAVEACPDLSLKAIYSRSRKSAETLAKSHRFRPDIYYDEDNTHAHRTPAPVDRTLDALLARKDIDAVIVALPIPAQAEVVGRALAAGKHVLSEKPIAKDIATATALVELYEKLPKTPVWGVGENYRFIEALGYAASEVRRIGGDLVTFRLEMYSCVQGDNKYLNTEWRRVPEYQGGFLLDGGVHFIAGLRLMLAAADEKVTEVTARTSLLQPNLPPVDTVHGVLTTGTDRHGTISMSFGTQHKSGVTIEVTTTKGCVTMTPVEVTSRWREGQGEEAREGRRGFKYDTGVDAEVAAFARGIREGCVDPRMSPKEGMRDLEILEGLLRSGEGMGTVMRFHHFVTSTEPGP